MWLIYGEISHVDVWLHLINEDRGDYIWQLKKWVWASYFLLVLDAINITIKNTRYVVSQTHQMLIPKPRFLELQDPAACPEGWHWNVEWVAPSLTCRTEHFVHFLSLCTGPRQLLIFICSVELWLLSCLCADLVTETNCYQFLKLHKSRKIVFRELHNVEQKRWAVYSSRRVLQHVHNLLCSICMKFCH